MKNFFFNLKIEFVKFFPKKSTKRTRQLIYAFADALEIVSLRVQMFFRFDGNVDLFVEHTVGTANMTVFPNQMFITAIVQRQTAAV